jgi:hypothetical protein
LEVACVPEKELVAFVSDDMIANRRRFDVANLQAEHAQRLVGQLSLTHSLPSGSLVEAKPCALCHGVEPNIENRQKAGDLSMSSFNWQIRLDRAPMLAGKLYSFQTKRPELSNYRTGARHRC